jgi:hypothetical protein
MQRVTQHTRGARNHTRLPLPAHPPRATTDAKYLGQTATDDFVTDVWTKAKFIDYYADEVRWRRPAPCVWCVCASHVPGMGRV